MTAKRNPWKLVLRIIVGIFFVYGLAVAVGVSVGYFVAKDNAAHQVTSILVPQQQIAESMPPVNPAPAPMQPSAPEVTHAEPGTTPVAAPVEHAPPVAASTPTIAAAPPKGWRENAISMPPYAYRDKKLIAIIFDDAGVNAKRTKEIIDVKSPLTISFLPYAPNLQRQVNAARAGGHEVMAHVPMEAEDVDAHPGPNALMTDMTDEEILASLHENLDKWNSYIGINNHMGSLFTADPHRIGLVLAEIKRRDLIFVDSMTSPKSIAAKKAQELGILTGARDVFLDDVDNTDNIKLEFKKLEKAARKHGTAIAIGHPRANTITALKEWLVAVENSEYMVVPLSVVLLERQKNAAEKHN